VLPKIKNQPQVNIWSAASSTGEEPYTIAMVLAQKLGLENSWQVLGTDINYDVLNTARRGVYSDFRIDKLPVNLKTKFLMRGTGSKKGMVAVVPEIKNRVSYRHFNLLTSDLPSQQFDVIFLRNVLIYFDCETKATVVERLRRALKPDGYLFSGMSESLHHIAKGMKTKQFSVYQNIGATH